MDKQEYFNIAKQIWKDDVPENGQSLTVQGELIRCIEKLRDEAQRNGDVNRDDGHLQMISYIRETLGSHESFSDEIKQKISTILDELESSEKIIIEDEPYDYLTERIVDLYKEKGSVAREENPKLSR